MISDNREALQKLAVQTLQYCMNQLQMGEDGLLRYVDAIDGEEISAHYGATHVATAFIVFGLSNDDTDIYKKGIDALKSVLERWNVIQSLPAFHFDFNNFALCVAYENLSNQEEQLKELIKTVVLQTADSNHDTINWLPMRWYVNYMRLQWTGNEQYKKICNRCFTSIRNATNRDGSIEDRLPRGRSYNLQYNIATVGCLQFLRNRGIDYPLGDELGFLLQSVLPDGDINYQGRGTNQIFAWSMWLYLLSTSGNSDALTVALHYLENRIPNMLAHHNLMLNDFKGEEKFLWWDYHYSSVYIAHLLFWVVMALNDHNGKSIRPNMVSHQVQNLQITRNDNCAIAVFGGREEYLSEQGPVVSAIWTRRHGMLMKGVFGPYKGSFGNRYIYEHIVLQNFCGLLQIKMPRDLSSNRYFRKLLPKRGRPAPQIQITPLFIPISVVDLNECLHIRFSSVSVVSGLFNLPLLTETSETDISLEVDGEKVALSAASKIRTQYDWCTLLQSKVLHGCVWDLKIKLS